MNPLVAKVLKVLKIKSRPVRLLPWKADPTLFRVLENWLDRDSKPAIIRQMERVFTEGKPIYLLPEGMEALGITKPPSVIMFCVDECAAISAYSAGSNHRIRATDEAADLDTPLVAAAAWLY